MRFRGLDLNLLFALRVLLEELSVSGAAARMNVSQPAMSAALGRLRQYFDDELLVQVGRRMVPTAFAEALRPMVEDLIQRADSLIGSTSAFDPQTSPRRFRISASDYMTTVLIGPLLRQFAQTAPGVCLDIVPTGPHTALGLEKGELDLVIYPEEYVQPQHPAELLLEDEHVVIGWRDNPDMATPIQRDRLFELGQVAVRFGTGQSASFAERHLATLFSAHRIEVTTSSFSSVPGLVGGTARVDIMKKRLPVTFVDTVPITVWPVPLELPPLRMMVQYHLARSGDPGISWLVRQMQDIGLRP